MDKWISINFHKTTMGFTDSASTFLGNNSVTNAHISTRFCYSVLHPVP